MKVEVAFHAPFAGTVAAVHVRRNERVAAGAAAGADPGRRAPRTSPRRVGARRPARLGRPAAVAVRHRRPPRPRRRRRASGAGARARPRAPSPPRCGACCSATTNGRTSTRNCTRCSRRRCRPDSTPSFLAELAEVRSAIAVFADIEVLFSRQPEIGAGRRGRPVQRRLAAPLSASHGRARRRPAGALSRPAAPRPGALRLRRSRARRGARTRPAAAVRRARPRRASATAGRTACCATSPVVAAAGLDLSDDAELAAALSTCIVLRGTVARRASPTRRPRRATRSSSCRRSAAAPPRHRRARASARRRSNDGAPGARPQTLQRLADSPPRGVRAHRGVGDGDRSAAPRRWRCTRWCCASTRRWCPTARGSPRRRRSHRAAPARGVPLAAGWTTVRTASCAPRSPTPSTRRGRVGRALRRAPSAKPTPPLLELLLTGGRAACAGDAARAGDVRCSRTRDAARAARVLDGAASGRQPARTSPSPPTAARLPSATELLGLHPETARRLDLQRLAEFALERLPAAKGSTRSTAAAAASPATSASSSSPRCAPRCRARTARCTSRLSSMPSPKRCARCAPSAASATSGAACTGTASRWSSGPALYLLPATFGRLVRELAPATRHLGLEKIVVRLDAARAAERRQRSGRASWSSSRPPADGSRLRWRDPHHDPLQPGQRHRAPPRRKRAGAASSIHTRRSALLTAERRAASRNSISTPTASRRAASSVAGRAAGGNRCGIVFGLITHADREASRGHDARAGARAIPPTSSARSRRRNATGFVAALDLAARARRAARVGGRPRRARASPWTAAPRTSTPPRASCAASSSSPPPAARSTSIVAGVNVGAQSYFDALATMLLHTRGVLIMLPGASMVLTGRLALEASGGVAAEDEIGIGGFERIMGPSGQAQYYARDLADAYEILLAHYRFTYRAPGERAAAARCRRAIRPTRSIADCALPGRRAGGLRVRSARSSTTRPIPAASAPFAMRPVMQALIDQDGGWLERWAAMAGAETAIVWDAHLGGHAVCLIGIESRNVPRLGPRANDGPERVDRRHALPAVVEEGRARPAQRQRRSAGGHPRQPLRLRRLARIDAHACSSSTAPRSRARWWSSTARCCSPSCRATTAAPTSCSRAPSTSGCYAIALRGLVRVGDRRRRRRDRRVRARGAGARRGGSAPAARRAPRCAPSATPSARTALRAALERLREEIALEQHGEVARAFDAVHTVERAPAVGSLDRIVAGRRAAPLLDRAARRRGRTRREADGRRSFRGGAEQSGPARAPQHPGRIPTRLASPNRPDYGQPAPPDAQSGVLPRMFMPKVAIRFVGTPMNPPS